MYYSSKVSAVYVIGHVTMTASRHYRLTIALHSAHDYIHRAIDVHYFAVRCKIIARFLNTVNQSLWIAQSLLMDTWCWPIMQIQACGWVGTPGMSVSDSRQRRGFHCPLSRGLMKVYRHNELLKLCTFWNDGNCAVNWSNKSESYQYSVVSFQ